MKLTCLSSPPRGNPRLPIGGTPPALQPFLPFLNPTGEKNPCWSCFLFTELPRIVIPLIGAVQLPGKVSGGRNLIPGPERAPLPPQSSTIALNNGLFFCSSTLRNICGYHPFSNCSKGESDGITHLTGQAESFFLMETYLAAQQIEPKLQTYIDGSFVQLARPHYTPTSLLPSLSITVSSQGSSAPAAASHCKKKDRDCFRLVLDFFFFGEVAHTHTHSLTYEINSFLLRTKQTRVAN